MSRHSLLRHLIVIRDRQGIIAYGLIVRITPLSPLSISSLSPEGVPFREQFGGGLAAIGLTIGKYLLNLCARRSSPYLI